MLKGIHTIILAREKDNAISYQHVQEMFPLSMIKIVKKVEL